MLTLLFYFFLHLTQIEGLPGQDNRPQYVRPASSMAPKYFELLEQNSHIIYPALGLLALGLVIIGIIQAWRSQDMDGLTKNEFKRAIVNELRSNLSGLPGDVLARAIGLERLKTMKLLEQMQQEGMISSYMSSNRMMVWRVRGTGNDRKDARY